jgi:hypothetical protein
MTGRSKKSTGSRCLKPGRRCFKSNKEQPMNIPIEFTENQATAPQLQGTG